MERVASTDLDRVEPEGRGELVHLALGDERRLWSPEAAERPTGHGVGVHDVAVDVGVGDLVGAALPDVAVSEHLVRRVVVGAGVQPRFALHGDDPTVAIGPPSGSDAAAMPLVVTDDRLFPRPLSSDGTPIAPLGQAAGGEGQDDLDRGVLAPAERATDRGVDHPHVVEGEVEGVGDLLGVLVGPLAGDLDGDPSVVVDVGEPGFGLEVGVLLVGQLIGRLRPPPRPPPSRHRMSPLRIR